MYIIYICILYILYGASDICQSVSKVHITIMTVYTLSYITIITEYPLAYITIFTLLSRRRRPLRRMIIDTTCFWNTTDSDRIIIINCLARPLTYCWREIWNCSKMSRSRIGIYILYITIYYNYYIYTTLNLKYIVIIYTSINIDIYIYIY